MDWQLRMAADVRAWLGGLLSSDPAAGWLTGAAIVALLDHGPQLGAPLVVPVEGRVPQLDPREILDEAYQDQLSTLTSVRHAVADAATARKRLELEIAEIEPGRAPERLAEMRARRAELARAEKELGEAAQRLQARAESFRARKEARKASYTVAQAQRAVNAAFAEFGEVPEPEVPFPDAEEALAAARSGVSDLLSTVPGRPGLDTSTGAAEASDRDAGGGTAPPAELLVLRPGAPECLSIRIVFTLSRDAPGQPSGAARTLVLLAAESAHTELSNGHEHDSEPDPLLAAALDHAKTALGTPSPEDSPSGEDPPPSRKDSLPFAEHSPPSLEDPPPSGEDSPPSLEHSPLSGEHSPITTVTSYDKVSSYDKHSFLGEFFPQREAWLAAEAAALVVARRPRGLAELRRRAGLTQAQVAERLGVRQERVSAIERGDPGTPEVRTVGAYLEAVGGRLELNADFGTDRVLLRLPTPE